MARPERFELPTTKFVAWYSIQLSYGRALKPVPVDNAAAQCITVRAERPAVRRGIILIGAADVNLFLHPATSRLLQGWISLPKGPLRHRAGLRSAAATMQPEPNGSFAPSLSQGAREGSMDDMLVAVPGSCGIHPSRRTDRSAIPDHVTRRLCEHAGAVHVLSARYDKRPTRASISRTARECSPHPWGSPLRAARCGAGHAAVQIRSRRIGVRPIHGAHPSALRAAGPALRPSKFVPDEFVERAASAKLPVLLPSLSARYEKRPTGGRFSYLAEREGFEPSIELLTLYTLSRGAPSTTRPSLRIVCPHGRPLNKSKTAAPGVAQDNRRNRFGKAQLSAVPAASPDALASGDSSRLILW